MLGVQRGKGLDPHFVYLIVRLQHDLLKLPFLVSHHIQGDGLFAQLPTHSSLSRASCRMFCTMARQ